DIVIPVAAETQEHASEHDDLTPPSSTCDLQDEPMKELVVERPAALSTLPGPVVESDVIEGEYDKPELDEEPEQEAQDDLIVPNPCDPRDTAIQQAIMERSDVPLEELEGFIDCSRMVNPPKVSTAIEQTVKAGLDGLCRIPFGNGACVRFKVLKKLGEGGFAKVYLVRQPRGGFISMGVGDDEDDDDDDDDDEEDEESDGGSEDDHDDEFAIEKQQKSLQQQHKSRLSALKVQAPADCWEFYALTNLRGRMVEPFLSSIVIPLSCHLFTDASCLRLQYCRAGTLLDVVNMSAKEGFGHGPGAVDRDGGVDELLAAFWAIELLRTVEGIHVAGFVHGDVKADNVLVRLDRRRGGGANTSTWEARYNPKGDGGWSSKGITLIDFGTAIDLLAFPEGQRFVIDSVADGFSANGGNGNRVGPRAGDVAVECWEVRNGMSTRYEPDWYGVAGVIHVLLFGRYMQAVGEAADGARPTLKLSANFKRYWQMDLWKRVFYLLLNSGIVTEASPGSTVGGDYDRDFEEVVKEFPAIASIREARRELETWLVGASVKGGKSLKSMLQRVEMASINK
ncbi:hypothetical protein HDU76_012984, partial [Blyttiomyces sp. JEL0837]